MAIILDFLSFKSRKEHKLKLRKVYQGLVRSNFKEYSLEDIELEEIRCLMSRNEFNESILYLLHDFMYKECPDLELRFDNYMKKIEEDIDGSEKI